MKMETSKIHKVLCLLSICCSEFVHVIWTRKAKTEKLRFKAEKYKTSYRKYVCKWTKYKNKIEITTKGIYIFLEAFNILVPK